MRLDELEPDVQHLNGGISGMAPDDYLVVLRRWVERQPVDLAVVYLFAGNDLIGMDAPHPCSAWQPIEFFQSDVRQQPGRVFAGGDSARDWPLFIEAVECYTTLGEICNVLRQEWGEYQEVLTI